LAPFLFHCSYFFAKVVNHEKAIKTNGFSMNLPFWKVSFRIKFQLFFHAFSDTLFGISFFLFFRNLMPKGLTLGTSWDQNGGQNRPSGAKMPPKHCPGYDPLPACVEDPSRVTLGCHFSWIWTPSKPFFMILARFRHRFFASFSQDAKDRQEPAKNQAHNGLLKT